MSAGSASRTRRASSEPSQLGAREPLAAAARAKGGAIRGKPIAAGFALHEHGRETVVEGRAQATQDVWGSRALGRNVVRLENRQAAGPEQRVNRPGKCVRQRR